MNFRRSHAREDPDINLIPLIDILIVILIFLFLTTTYSRFAELQINLPEASAERRSDRPADAYRSRGCGGKYASTARPSLRQYRGLRQRLREAAKGAKEPVIAISADAAATHQSVINVMEAARLAGYNHISFTTQTKR